MHASALKPHTISLVPPIALFDASQDPFMACRAFPSYPWQAPGGPSQLPVTPAASTGIATVAVICEGLVALVQPGPAGVHQLHKAVRTVRLTLASQSLFLSLLGADVIPSLAQFLLQ